MTDLIKRLEAASAGSRELDAALCEYFDLIEDHCCPLTGPQKVVHLGKATYCTQAPVTRSLDAATALAERVLPGWKWSVNQLDYGCTGWVKPPLKTHGDLELQDLGEGAAHASACIALTIATLKAHALLETEV